MIFVEARTLGSTTNDNDLLHVKPRMFMRIQIIVPTVKSYNEYRVVDILYTFARYLLSIFKFPNTRILKLLFEKQKIYLEIMTTFARGLRFLSKFKP